MAIRRPHGGRILATGVLAAVTAIVATATPAAAAPTASAPSTTTDQSSQISLLISLLSAPA
ncbi:hypothetical protein ACWKSP_22665 [Micromonosporaceae bacterium Da 78-11]